MKWLVSLLLAVASTCVWSSNIATMITPSPLGAAILILQSYIKDQKKIYYVRVESQAANFEQAQQQAFRLASEQVAGTVVLSESELRNSNLTRNEIITYSSGIVDRFQIISRVDAPGQVRLVVDVWIAESVMAQRLLARSATERGINGTDLAVTTSTILDERQRGDAIFRAVLRDFPKRAFVVKMSRPRIAMDPVRNVVATVDVEIAWDRRYILAFYDAAKQTGRKPCVWNCAQTAKFYIQGWEFDDIQKLLIVDQHIVAANSTLQLDIVDTQGRVSHRQCMALGNLTHLKLYGFGGNQLNLWEYPYRVTAHMDLGQNTAAMARVENLRAEIVNGAQCR